MSIANGTHAELRFRGRKVAKVSAVSMETQRQTLETTGIGDRDDTFSYGKRTHSGSATLFYKINDQPTQDLMNRILEDGDEPDGLEMIIYKGSPNGRISGPVLISSQGTAVSTGDSTRVNISFVIDGKPSGRY
jgi:hypothetical protein